MPTDLKIRLKTSLIESKNLSLTFKGPEYVIGIIGAFELLCV